MVNIEKALFNVFASIGNGYDIPDPTQEFLTSEFDGSQIRNPYYGQTPQPIKFEMGTQKELDIWIANTTDKYPVVWLVYPYKKSFNNDGHNIEYYKRCILIFAINNDVGKYVKTRLTTTAFVLDSIVRQFLELLRNRHFTYIFADQKSEITQEFLPNMATNEKKQGASVVIDNWDAIYLQIDLYLILQNCENLLTF